MIPQGYPLKAQDSDGYLYWVIGWEKEEQLGEGVQAETYYRPVIIDYATIVDGPFGQPIHDTTGPVLVRYEEGD